VGYKILLADDSVTVQKIITLTFSDEGVDVVSVNNGDEAISRLQYLRPALVMADVSIPGRNGYEICEFVKTHPEMKDTPVILLVPAFEPFDEERARRIGADYHLTKPFQSIRTLISMVKNLVEHKADVASLVGGGLTAIRDSDQKAPETSESDPKRAKIEELIRLSAQASSRDEAEDEVLLEVDIPGTLDSGDVAEAPNSAEVVTASRGAAIESYPTRTAGTPAPALRVSAENPEEDMEDVLDLDDLSLEAESAPAAQTAVQIDGLAGADPEAPASAEPAGKQQSLNIPQSVIDEIADRVAARLTEKLSDEIVRRLAHELAEIAKGHLHTSPVAYHDSENLLDID
jgi:CheY-like chemotaxis protein